MPSTITRGYKKLLDEANAQVETIIRRLLEERMFPLTLEGLEGAMKELTR